MPSLLKVSRSAFCVIALLSVCREAPALCMCFAPEPTLAERIDGANVVALGKWLRSVPKKDDGDGYTEFEILEVARQPAADKFNPLLNDDTLQPVDFLPAGRSIIFPNHHEGTEDSLFLLTGTVEDGVMTWSTAHAITPAGFEFALNAPAPDAPLPSRIKYFARYFDSRDAMIADEAYVELSRMPFADLAQQIDDFPRLRLRRLLTSEQPPNRIGLYALLLGLKGTSQDADILERMILSDNSEFRLGMENVISGYLLLKGEVGLEIIETVKLKCDGVVFSETYAAFVAIRFMTTDGRGTIPLERLQRSLRLLLDNLEMADLVISELQRTKDWSAQDRLIELQSDVRFHDPSIQRAIARYMMAATGDFGHDSLEWPAHVLKAEQYLERLKQRDAATFAVVSRQQQFRFGAAP